MVIILAFSSNKKSGVQTIIWANQKRRRQSNYPITTRGKFRQPTPSLGKYKQENHNFLFACTSTPFHSHLICAAIKKSFIFFFINLSLDITVMECLSRSFEVKTIPFQVPYLGPTVSMLSAS